MSLRTDIHAALDELAPVSAGAEQRLIAAPPRHSDHRARPTRWRSYVKTPLALVAVFVLIALIAGMLVGGRLLRDWEAQSQTIPGGHVNQQDVRPLEGRTLTLPLVSASDPCAGGPWDATTGWWGRGPVYLYSLFGSGYSVPQRGAWGNYFLFHVKTPAGMKGPLLIRARDLVSGQALVFVGRYAYGPAVGADVVAGTPVQQHSELAIQTDASPPPANHGYVDWGFTVGVHVDQAAPTPLGLVPPISFTCTGWQFDAAGFSNTVEVPI